MRTQSVLKHSSYTPARGGHAPGDIRDAFLEAIEAFEAWEDDEPEPTVEVRERQMTIREVCGLLWNCSDTMPGLERRQLEALVPYSYRGRDPAGSCGSYARAARTLRWMVNRVNSPEAQAA
ncbi:hypothetical protein [Methylobacterium sp. WSM2598]|uniref:hypothetical protein n=1 Tax=Methylobacterium sp. WSM2598 TaxID=398261 RepID=UPI0003695691|nr:hypothetical protein [Methylobacterium sp. WSM2598]